MIRVPIQGHGGAILIDVVGYENLAARDASDANWLQSRIQITAGPFSGQFDAALTTLDFPAFENDLNRLLLKLEGSATFETEEGALRFEVTMGPRGTCLVSVLSKVDVGVKVELHFVFESDQSWLAETQRAVTKVVKQFPTRDGGRS